MQKVRPADYVLGGLGEIDHEGKLYFLGCFELSQEEVKLYMALDEEFNSGNGADARSAAIKTGIPEEKASYLLSKLAHRKFVALVSQNPNIYKPVPFCEVMRQNWDTVEELDLIGGMARRRLARRLEPTERIIDLSPRQLSILQYVQNHQSEVFPGVLFSEMELDCLEGMGFFSSRKTLGKKLYKLKEKEVAKYKAVKESEKKPKKFNKKNHFV